MNPGIVTLLLVVANIAFSYKGLKDINFYSKYNFQVDHILLYKDYKRLVTSAFLHVNWTHLVFNMMGLFFIGSSMEAYIGGFQLLVIYFAAMIGGDLLALQVHKHNGSYSAAGASGAILGVLFAYIALFPDARVGLFLLPISIPAWIFGPAFVLYSIYGIRSRKSNVGHEAHLGGALIGMCVALLFHPTAFLENYGVILLIAVPTLIFIYIIVTRPHVLLIDNYFFKKQKRYYSIDHKYNEDHTNKQKEIDRILDKIGKKGMDSLSREEKKKLEEYARS